MDNAGFVEDYLGMHNRTTRSLLYADSEFGFCIFAHVYTDAKGGEPHDHAGTWAIYGQASGTTEMTEWRKTRAPDGERPGVVEPVKPYPLQPEIGRALCRERGCEYG